MLLAAVVGAVAGAAVAFTAEPLPSATVLVHVTRPGTPPGMTAASDFATDPQRIVDSAVTELSNGSTLRELGPTVPDHVSVASVPQADYLKITATGDTDADATALANRVSVLLQRRSGETIRAQVDQQITATQSVIADLGANEALAGSDEAAAAVSRLAALQSSKSMSPEQLGAAYGGVEPVGEAEVDAPSGLRDKGVKIGGAAILAGLLALAVLLVESMARDARRSR